MQTEQEKDVRDLIDCFFCGQEVEDKGKIYCEECIGVNSKLIPLVIKLAERVNDLEVEVEDLNAQIDMMEECNCRHDH